MFLVRLLADERPIFFAYFLVYRSWAWPVKTVRAVLLWPRNPVLVASLQIVVISLEAGALEALKCSPFVMETLSCFGEGDASNASWTHHPVRALGLRGLILDVHDAWRRHG